jgi:hypothetical protein
MLFGAKATPEFVIDFARDGDEVVGFKLRNTSSQNLYNLSVVNMKSRVGEIFWWENFFTCIEARIGEIVLKPYSSLESSIRFQDVPALKKVLAETPGGTNPEIVGVLEIYADDAEGNQYRFSTDIQLRNGWTWRVWETDRALVKPKVTAQIQ